MIPVEPSQAYNGKQLIIEHQPPLLLKIRTFKM